MRPDCWPGFTLNILAHEGGRIIRVEARCTAHPAWRVYVRRGEDWHVE